MFCEIRLRNLFNGFLILLITSFFAACAGSYLIAEPDLLTEMKKTPCYGQCPVYTIKISKNGKGLFEGTKNVDNIGTYRFRLSGKEIDELIETLPSDPHLTVALKQQGSWTYGMLANHIWSVAGDDDRADINSTFVQPFLAYVTSTHTTFSLNTESTYDWESEEWSVPINFMVAQMVVRWRLR